MTKTTITNRIRALRYQAGEMSQQSLADAVGVTRQTINAIEGAKYSPSLEVAFRIADTLGVAIDEVFQHGSTGSGTKNDRVSQVDPFD